MILISLSVKAAFAVKLSSAGLAHGNIAQAALTAAYAMRDAPRFGRPALEIMTCSPCAPLRGCEYPAGSLLCYQKIREIWGASPVSLFPLHGNGTRMEWTFAAHNNKIMSPGKQQRTF